MLSHLEAGIQLAKNEQVDLILAVGGGSVMDEAKGIAAGACTDEEIWNLYCGTWSPEKALPVITIPTMPATGSHMNGGTVITKDSTFEKFGTINPLLHPTMSFLDPEITHSLPPDQTAYGSIDAISHLLESYFTGEAEWSPIQDRYAEGLILSIMEATDRALQDPADNEARAVIMWASTLAWNGLGYSGVGAFASPNHMIEHPLSGRYNLAHGAGLAIVIPAWMDYASQEKPTKFAQFAERIFGITDNSEDEQAQRGVEALRDWFRKTGAPVSLAEGGISPDSEIPTIADDALHLGTYWGMTNYTREDIIQILQATNVSTGASS